MLFLCLVVCLGSTAQDFNNYKPLRSSGSIPKKFITTSTEKYNAEVHQNISRKDKRSVKKAKKQFFLESNFEIDELLLSGKVLFNDPVSRYTSRVLDQLLKNDKETRSKIEVYAVRSDEVNAFTTNNGIIFVTMGLLAQLENEAELAYVLSHEVTHFTKQHVLKQAIKDDDIRNERGSYRKTSYDDKLLARSQYSKQQESEADLEGYYLYLKTNYDLKTLDGVFDALQYAHLPFDEVPFKKEVLETKYLKLPKGYFLAKVKEVEANDRDDTLGTHPGVSIRREAIMSLADKENNKGRKEFIVSEDEFYKIQKMCRFEISTLDNQHTRYEASLYNSYLLMQDDPNSKYLKVSLGKSLYGLSKYANDDRFDKVHYSPEDMQGESEQVYFLFDKLTKKEKNVLAVSYLWRLKKQYPDDKELAAITDDIFHEMVVVNYNDKSYFSTTPRPLNDTTQRDTAAATLKPTESGTETKPKKTAIKKQGKYQHIRKAKKKEGDEDNERGSFARYAFVDLLQDPEFNADYDKYAKDVKKTGKSTALSKKARNKKLKEDRKKEAEKQKEQARLSNGGYALGISKVLIINPFYYKVDYTHKQALRLVASEAAQKDFNNSIKENATFAGIDYTMLDKKDLDSSSTAVFNDITSLNDFIRETSLHGDMHYVNYMSDDIQALAKKYGTSYFCWTGMIVVKNKKVLNLNGLCLGIIYPILPLVLIGTFTPDYHTYLYNYVINTEDGSKVYDDIKHYKYRDRQDVVNSGLYDLYSQFKKHRD